jgi:hypothetical protein
MSVGERKDEKGGARSRQPITAGFVITVSVRVMLMFA